MWPESYTRIGPPNAAAVRKPPHRPMDVPSRSEHPSRNPATRTSSKASRSSDLRTIEGILAASRAAGMAPNPMSTHEDDRPARSARPNAGHALLGPPTDRAHARLRKARGNAAPRTALLPSRVAPPLRGARLPRARPEAQPGLQRDASHTEAMSGEHPLGFDPKEPLLTTAELDAFFGAPAPATNGRHGGLAVADEASSGAADLDPNSTEKAANSALETYSGAGPSARPPWLRDQAADLADIVQTLELRARASHSHVGISAELARLRQFTRTIGYVASPPPRGGQNFDVAIHVEEQLGAMVGDRPDAPRLLFKREGEQFDVVADKALVAQAFEALLRTATNCCGAGDVVRVSVLDTSEADTRLARTTIEFPKGPLAPLTPAAILEPYALKGLLSGVGAHALSAAGAITVGQGGDLQLEEISKERFAFVVELPRVEATGRSSESK